MNQESSVSRFATRHHLRFWRWVAFDPPMRDAGSRGCRKRAVTCQECSSDLGTIDDPLDGFFMAWRHRRSIRRSAGSSPAS
jgi:hypothetical protein